VIDDDGIDLGEVWRGDLCNRNDQIWYAEPPEYTGYLGAGTRKEAVDLLARWRQGKPLTRMINGIRLHCIFARNQDSDGNFLHSFASDQNGRQTHGLSVSTAFSDRTDGMYLAGWAAHCGKVFVSGAISLDEAVELAVTERLRVPNGPEVIERLRRTSYIDAPLIRVYGTAFEAKALSHMIGALFMLERADGSYQLGPAVGPAIFVLKRDSESVWSLRDAAGNILKSAEKDALLRGLGVRIYAVSYEDTITNSSKASSAVDLPMLEAIHAFAVQLDQGVEPATAAAHVARDTVFEAEWILEAFSGKYGDPECRTTEIGNALIDQGNDSHVTAAR